MKLQFDATLPFQRDAIDAVVDLFAGQPAASSGPISFNAGALLQTELGLANHLALSHDQLLTNLQQVQRRNRIEPVTTSLPAPPHYAVEMETGTGKTYVYLRTAFELHKQYGFAKFVIVVPSVAIREGVLHSLTIMRDHFSTLYDAVPFDSMVYDSKQLGRIRGFATANHLQFMVINIQAFQRDVNPDEGGARRGSANVIYVEQDRLSGHRPIEYLQRTNPIVIIDEPQKMEGTASTRAIQQLNPLCTLRYSATYDSDAKVFRLGPIEALERKLVKRIEVASVVPDENVNEAYVELVGVDIRGQKAKLKINVGGGAAVKQRQVTVKARDDLFVKSKERQEYRTGFQIREISFRSGDEFIQFTNGQTVRPGAAANDFSDEVMREQIRVTIREHLRAEERLRPRGIKVLSLFFIDQVANYRRYHDDGSGWSLGKIGRWFEEIYLELTGQMSYLGIIPDPVTAVHDGYFSKDRHGSYRDTRGNTKDDDSTYELIMKDKERLLSFETPLRFIFSHSALREGWDNPNVFQICTLNESRSVVRKRQEIGRGLRLPVNQQGERIHDEGINRLVVVANESYHEFARGLQSEYEEDLGVQFGVVPAGAFAEIELTQEGETRPIDHVTSTELWRHLRDRGYIGDDGRLVDAAFTPGRPGFELDVPPELAEARARIVDVLRQYQFSGRVIKDARTRQQIATTTVLNDPEFQTLWRQISQRTRYHVVIDTDELINEAAERIRRQPDVLAPEIRVDIAAVDVSRTGVKVREAGVQYREIARQFPIPDILGYLQNETDLTRQTLAQILIRSGKVEQVRRNPQAFLTMAAREIMEARRGRTRGGIRYERVQGHVGDVWRLEEEASRDLGRFIDTLYPVTDRDRSPFSHIELDSQVEHEFARRLDHDRHVRFFVKLPSWFTVDTPIGTYNPDWAICYRPDDATEDIYLVAETKGSLDEWQLRPQERDKIDFGRLHFDAIDVGYQVATTFDDIARTYTLPTSS